VTRLDTLKSLQSRIREATGAMERHACELCRFSSVNEFGRPTGFSEPRYYPTLHCRRYPPNRSFSIENVTASTAAAWPEVDRNWWCGEFQQGDLSKYTDTQGK